MRILGLLLGLLFVSHTAFALTPPRSGDVEALKKSGVWQERLDRAERLANHKVSAALMGRARQRLNELTGDVSASNIAAPPPAWQGLPTTGSPKMLAVLVDFPDYPHAVDQTVADVQLKMFGAGSAAPPFDSLRNFYQRSSNNLLTLQGNVLGWYRAAHNRSYYEALGDGAGQTALINEALGYYATQGHDFAQYDNDNDGTIDAFFIKWTGPDTGWNGFWWAYQTTYQGSATFGGKAPGPYVWSWYSGTGSTTYYPDTDIHETGHLLGVPDYYDYDDSVGPRGGVGGLDIMDAVWGDHNAFSKFMLGWLTPTIVASGSTVKALSPTGSTGSAVLMMPGATSGSLFSEYFIAQYRKRGVGNDPSNYPTDGLVIWHVDATLNGGATDFAYDNSYTGHKLLRLMEADGLEEIEQNSWVDAGDFYIAGATFGQGTWPNSERYSGVYTGVTVNGIGAAGATLSATFAVQSGAYSLLTVTKTGAGTVASQPAGIVCGADCLGSFPTGSSVTLTATPTADSSFLGWSGACSGMGNCVVTMSSAKSVTANFSPPDDGFPSVTSGLPPGWTQPGGSNAAWAATSGSAYVGSYSLKSGVITHSQKSIVVVSGTYIAGTISFARRVSSEAGYDKLNFYIDGVLQQSWSGEVAWGLVSYSVAAGSHEFRWEYAKDSSGSAGSDAAWIDRVALPLASTLQVTTASLKVKESAGQAVITVTRSGGTGNAVSVNYAAAAGTASPGADYAATSGTLTWATGESSAKTIIVPIIADATAEPTEWFNVTLSNPTGGAVLGASTTKVNILGASVAPIIMLLLD